MGRVIRGKLKRAQFLLTLAVFSVPLASFIVAAFLRFATRALPRYTTDAEPRPYFGLLLLTTILWAIGAEYHGLTAIENHLHPQGNVRRILLACLSTYLTVLSVLFFYRDTSFSRVFIWLSSMNIVLLALLVSMLFRKVWQRSHFSQTSSGLLLIIGADEFAARVADSLAASRLAPCGIVGHIILPGQTSAIRTRPVFELSQIERLAIGNGFTDVILALSPDRLAQLPSLREKLAPLCAPMRLVLDVGEGVQPGQNLFHLGDLLLLDLQSTPAESTLYVLLKRAFDLVFSAFVLVLAAPLLGLIALAVRLTSPGPAIFVQDRVGLNGQVFRMYKFRTMRVAPQEEKYTRLTAKDDPRRTRLGKFLRQTSLDELPQFFNVLKGDMSVVGPRPEGPILVQRFMQSVGNYNRRHFLKVGITGWAQVNGWRGDTSIEKRVEYDLYYMRHWTLRFDLLIVVLTFFRGFTDKNAY
jgi:Undecaprenyl-phosphate glucose phosphotransferase